MLDKKELDHLIKIEGKARGVVFQTDASYVLEKKGKEGLEKLKEKTKTLNYDIPYETAKATEWYPIGLRAISLLVIKDTFDWPDKEISNIGNAAPKYSFIVKMLMRYFISLDRGIKETSKYWEKHYSFGRLEPYKFSEKEKYVIMRLYDFKVHPILCTYLFEDGYFMRIGQYMTKGKDFSSKEIKCMHKGDPYHECLITWK